MQEGGEVPSSFLAQYTSQNTNVDLQLMRGILPGATFLFWSSRYSGQALGLSCRQAMFVQDSSFSLSLQWYPDVLT